MFRRERFGERAMLSEASVLNGFFRDLLAKSFEPFFVYRGRRCGNRSVKRTADAAEKEFFSGERIRRDNDVAERGEYAVGGTERSDEIGSTGAGEDFDDEKRVLFDALNGDRVIYRGTAFFGDAFRKLL